MPDDWSPLFEERLRRLAVPEREIVPLGLGGGRPWTPTDEAEPPRRAKCPKCFGGGDGDGGIEPGSLFYCPKCKASGFDQKLTEQRIVEPAPPPERPTKRPKAEAEPGKPKKRAGRTRREA